MAAEDDSGAKQAEESITVAGALDAPQFGLDVVGTFAPTPFADLANATISAARGNWFDAAVTAAGALPGFGDSLKALKYSDEALAAARRVRRHAEEAADAARALSRRAEEAAQVVSHTADDYRDAARYTHSHTTLDAENVAIEIPTPGHAKQGGGSSAVETQSPRPTRQYGKRMTSRDDAIEQLEEVEVAQRKFRQGKNRKQIDSIERSKQRARNRLREIRDLKDLEELE